MKNTIAVPAWIAFEFDFDECSGGDNYHIPEPLRRNKTSIVYEATALPKILERVVDTVAGRRGSDDCTGDHFFGCGCYQRKLTMALKWAMRNGSDGRTSWDAARRLT